MAPRGMIAAVTADLVIGLAGKIPWHYPADLKRFKALTLGGTVVMGRLTWESMPKRPLPGRRNVVLSSQQLEGVECFPSIPALLETVEGPLWFIGGARVYQEAMAHADVIDLTWVPDRIFDPRAVKFPPIDEAKWRALPRAKFEDDGRLEWQRFERIAARVTSA